MQIAHLKELYERHKSLVPALTFLAGVLWDVSTLERIDQWTSMAQLGAYLVIVMGLLTLEILDTHQAFILKGRLARLWHHRIEAVHFFLGSLLSAFTIFYFKSASLLPSLLFFLLIAGLLVGNELPALRRLGLTVRTVLLGVCLTSYLACVTPVWWGHLGYLPFLTSLAASAALFGGLLFALRRRVDNRDLLLKRVAGPYAATLAVFLGCYALHLIPPVPLALTKVGIYHNVERIPGGYRLTSMRPPWKFWQHGDQVFTARPGDRIFCFFSIFSPAGFHDSLKVRWLYKDDKSGWQHSDAVPVAINGGRAEGWRGFSFKANFKPGDWQVRIETSDEREIGRIGVTVAVPGPGDVAPELQTEVL